MPESTSGAPENYRIEEDSLGEVRVPQSARYGAQTQRAVENFPVSGYTLPVEFLHAVVAIKKAAAEANFCLGILDKEVADAITAACDRLS